MGRAVLELEKRLKYWLAFGRLRGAARLPLRELFDACGDPEGVFAAGEKALGDFSKDLHAEIAAFNAWDWVDNEAALIEKSGAALLTFLDPGYPALLKEINDPPCVLYVKGDRAAFEMPSVAVVGTRHPSHYGLKISEALARDVAASGAAVVSGMARGCDSAAHRGALEAGGRTIAVLGTGVDVPYPRENAKLYGQIIENGAVVSELPMSTPPAPYNFPKRNRVISGLSMGVVVVEAPLRSGALQTARLALDYNRDVFSVPGPVTSPKSMGTNRLIKEGAMLVETAQDVLSALGIRPGASAGGARTVALGNDERAIWDALKDEPVHIDALVSATGLATSRAAALLLEMELKGLIAQRPGMCFLRRA